VTGTGRDPRPVRTVFLGSGGFAVPILHAVAGHPSLDLVAIVTAPARPAGRKAEPRSTRIADAAPPGIPVLTPARLRDPAAIEEILALDPGLLVLADYGRIVPRQLLDPPHGALNLHPSLLPRHRGASPVPATILADDRETGVSLMRMDEGLDTGPLVAVERVALVGTETTPMLEARLAILGGDLFARSIDGWLAGELRATDQAADGATLTRPLRREDGRIDPSAPAAAAARQVRAYAGWPGTFVDTAGGRLTILEAHEGAADATAGPPVPGRFDATGLGTVDGRLALDLVQPAGGRAMTWDAFLRGRPGILGTDVVPAG
jgi:methionyl-tRNA formyltransferase